MRISDHDYTRLRVLRALREAEPVARTQLAQLSGVTGATITEIVGDLVERGLVLEDKVRSGSRGRPRVNLRLNPEGSHVVGVFHGLDAVLTVGIVNLKGESRFTHSEALPPTSRLDERARQMAEIVGKALAASPFSKDEIGHVGVGLPAIVDFRSGMVEYMATFDAGPCPFAEIMADELQLPVTIDNDVNVLARAEYWFGQPPGVADFVLIVAGLALGCAIYAAGQIAIGAHGLRPEIGHTKVVAENGRLCRCGARGCLQAYSSVTGLADQYAELRGCDLPPFTEWNELARRMVAEAEAGDRQVRDILERASRFLGIAVANQINLSDPSRILLLFEEPVLAEAFSDSFLEALDENTLPVLRGQAEREIRVMDRERYWQGAAAIGLEHIYQFR